MDVADKALELHPRHENFLRQSFRAEGAVLTLIELYRFSRMINKSRCRTRKTAPLQPGFLRSSAGLG